MKCWLALRRDSLSINSPKYLPKVIISRVMLQIFQTPGLFSHTAKASDAPIIHMALITSDLHKAPAADNHKFEGIRGVSFFYLTDSQWFTK